jgi:hypothetical protein
MVANEAGATAGSKLAADTIASECDDWLKAVAGTRICNTKNRNLFTD